MKNAWKILGGCGCLSILLGIILVGSSYFIANGGDAVPPVSRDDLATYTNTREGRTGNLAESYVDFSFNYPKEWTVKANDPDNINFVTVERSMNGQTWENVNVGYYTPADTEEGNQALFRQVLGQIEGQFSQQFRDFTKISEGPMKIGEYDGYQTLYSGWVDSQGTRIDVYTRAAFVPTPDKTKGVSFMMMGTSLNPALKEPNDLGTKGETPIILQSFKF